MDDPTTGHRPRRRAPNRRAVVPVAAQAAGVAVALTGVFALLGLGWTLLVGGLALAVIGTLAEGGRM